MMLEVVGQAEGLFPTLLIMQYLYHVIPRSVGLDIQWYHFYDVIIRELVLTRAQKEPHMKCARPGAARRSRPVA